jgi:ABC-type dipeptide/oligopeptide/nickel transport system ATPase component
MPGAAAIREGWSPHRRGRVIDLGPVSLFTSPEHDYTKELLHTTASLAS